MDLENKERVNSQICEVFERMAFMFGDAIEPEEMPEPPDGCFRAEVRFRGDRQGALVMMGASELCPILAANVLGADPEDDEAMARSDDAIKELLNVACGHVLTTLAGEGPIFDLGAPTVAKATSADLRAFVRDQDSLAFVMEDHPLAVQFRWEETGQ
ncbi:MAG: chemotaxis protein CheX [Candidatus Eisenbacteria bacterium]